MGIGTRVSPPGTFARVSISSDIPSKSVEILDTSSATPIRFPSFSSAWKAITLGIHIASLHTCEEAKKGTKADGNTDIHLFPCNHQPVPTAMAMLKITTVKTNRQCRIVVEGELVSSGVGVLKRAWDEARVSAGCLTLIVDLRNVIAIGQEGKDVLLEMMNEGVRFICRGVHNRHVLQQLARKINL
jgi:hypothetical protein